MGLFVCDVRKVNRFDIFHVHSIFERTFLVRRSAKKGKKRSPEHHGKQKFESSSEKELTSQEVERILAREKKKFLKKLVQMTDELFNQISKKLTSKYGKK